jgi:hypothetical protein
LFKIFNIFCIKTTHNFERINIFTPNYVYYKIVELTLRCEYHSTLIFHKTLVIYIRNCCLNRLFNIFNVHCLITRHNFVKINIITPNYVCYKIIQLTLRYEHFRTRILHKILVRCIKNSCLNKLFEFYFCLHNYT